jgi:hypothetical protein
VDNEALVLQVLVGAAAHIADFHRRAEPREDHPQAVDSGDRTRPAVVEAPADSQVAAAHTDWVAAIAAPAVTDGFADTDAAAADYPGDLDKGAALHLFDQTLPLP